VLGRQNRENGGVYAEHFAITWSSMFEAFHRLSVEAFEQIGIYASFVASNLRA
jgi:hypothetical protein